MTDNITEQRALIQRIKDALGTEEDGEALVEVARNAHKAELELLAIQRREDEQYDIQEIIDRASDKQDGLSERESHE